MIIDNRYLVEEIIGSGGAGRVYRVLDRVSNETLALKLLENRTPAKEEEIRFKKEFSKLVKLNHPNIIKVYDFGLTSEGQLYFTMDYIEGKDLYHYFSSRLDYSVLNLLIIDICLALDYLHSQGLIHRDIKPSNILIKTIDGQPRAVVTDFGLVEEVNLSGYQARGGSHHYVSPEGVRGWKLDQRADLYSLGATLYEVVARRRVFEDKSALSVLRKHLYEKPQPLRTFNPSVPLELENLISKLLEKHPLNRYQSAFEVIDELSKVCKVQVRPNLQQKAFILSGGFVGREKEIAILKETLEKAKIGRGQLILITGEPGIGKTRLLREFSIHSQLERSKVVWVNCADRANIPFGSVVDMVRGLIGGSPQGLKLTAEEQALVDKISPSEKRRLSTKLETLLQGDPLAGFEVLTSVIKKAVKNIGPASLVAIFDHLNAADAISLDFLRYFAFNMSNVPVVICASFCQSEEILGDFKMLEFFKEEDFFQHLHLEALSKEKMTLLLKSKLVAVEDLEGLVEFIHQRTGGNPLFVEEVLMMLLEEGMLYREGGKWYWKVHQDKIKTPQRIKELFQKRFTRLSPKAVEVVQILAVAGERVEADMLRRLIQTDEDSLYSAVEELVEAGILQQERADGKHIYEFTQANWRDFIYEGLSPKRRSTLHRQIALTIEESQPAPSDEVLSSLAYYCFKGLCKERAQHYLPQAAKYAREIFDYEKAAKYLEWNLSLLSKDQKRQRLRVHEQLGEIYELLGRYDESLQNFKAAEDLVQQLGESNIYLTEIRRKLAMIHGKRGENDQALELLEKCVSLMGEGKRLELARIYNDIGWIYRIKADYPRAIEYHSRSLDILSGSEEYVELGNTYNRLGVVYLSTDNLAEAERCFDESLKYFEKIKDKRKIAYLYNNMGILKRKKGDMEGAIAKYEGCLKINKKIRNIADIPVIINNLANIWYEKGDWDEAVRLYQESLRMSKSIRLEENIANCYGNLGLIYYHKGEWQDALKYQRKGVIIKRKIGNAYEFCQMAEYLADTYLVLQRTKSAMKLYQRVLKLREEINDIPGIIWLNLTLGKLSLELNDFLKANDYLRKIEDFPLKFGYRCPLEVYSSLLESSLKLSRREEIEKYFKLTQKHLKSTRNKLEVSKSQRILGLYHLYRKNIKEAERCLLESEKGLSQLGALHELAKTYKYLGDLKCKAEDFDQALNYLRKSLNILEKLGREKEVLELYRSIDAIQTKMIQNYSQLMVHQDRTETLRQTSLLIHSMFDLEKLLNYLMDMVITLLKADKGAIIFCDQTSGGLEVKVGKNIEKETLRDALKISNSIINRVEKTGKSVLSTRTDDDQRFKNSESVISFNICSLMCVPIRIEDRLIGTLYVDSRNPERTFQQNDLEFLENIAHLAAVVISNSEYYQELKEERDRLTANVMSLREAAEQRFHFDNVVGRSPAMQQIFATVNKILDRKVDVLIRGESGTGKEKIAGLIHFNSPRKDKPFVKVNCAALPQSLLESELFGIEKRVATGVDMRKGKFEQADGGTIFLDEIGDMSLETQAKILRVIQEREFERIGGDKTIKIDVRIIAATNKDLEQAVKNKGFREDLYYRLNVFPIFIPPLRERKEDIPELIRFFIKKYSKTEEEENIMITEAAMQRLLNYNWPGNVRELENVIHRALIFSDGKKIRLKDLPPEIRGRKEGIGEVMVTSEDISLEEVERRILEKKLAKFNWNITKTAKHLGIHRNTLQRRMKRLGIHRVNKKSQSQFAPILVQ